MNMSECGCGVGIGLACTVGGVKRQFYLSRCSWPEVISSRARGPGLRQRHGFLFA